MSMIHTWCTYHGVKWFYNPKEDIWIFYGKRNTCYVLGSAMRNDPRLILDDLEFYLG